MKVDKLLEHPEGGRFREVYRSTDQVRADDGRLRSALTHIYFELNAGEVSRFHKVESDEVWNLYEGSFQRAASWVWWGAVLFLLSDSCIGLNKFGQHLVEIPQVRFVIMSTYLLGQLGIVYGTSQLIKTPQLKEEVVVS